MATKPAEEAPEQLKYRTWVLKVSIHCEGCSKKVKKVLQGIEGVYKVDVDSQQHKVTVTGNVEAETLLKKLLKSGKHADLWPENPTNKNKKKKKKKKNKSNNDNANPGGQEAGVNNNNDDDDDEEDGEKIPPQAVQGSDHDGEESPEEEEEEEDEAAGEVPAPNGGKKKKKKKKKKNNNNNNNKGQNGNVGGATSDSGTVSLGMVPNMLPSQQVYPYGLQMYYPTHPPSYGLSYNTVYPSASASYYATPNYGHYGSTYNRYHPLPPLSDRIYHERDHDHFDYHDEDEVGCSVM